MASVREIKTKLGKVWQARWRERGRDCAKNFPTMRAAKAHAARKMDQVEGRGIGDPDRLTTAAYFERFMAEIESGDYSPATVDMYRRVVQWVSPVIGAVALRQLTTVAIEDGYQALLTAPAPLAHNTVRLIHRILVVALNRAARKGLIAHNPALNASPSGRNQAPPKRRRSRVFTTAEVDALLAAARDESHETLTIVSLLLASGVRRSELLGLRLGDVDLDQGLLHVRGAVISVKGNAVVRDRGKSAAAERTLALPPTVIALLRVQCARVQEMMAGSGVHGLGFLFPGPLGRPMRPKLMTDRLKRLMRGAGITEPRAPCHAWRHTSGTLTFDATTNIKLVQARLGHANVSTTMGLYVHSLEEREREAADHFERLLTANKG
jgi:integrase